MGPLIDTIVGNPGDYPSGKLRKGQTLRIIDLDGQQCADFSSFNLHNPVEQYNGPLSQAINSSFQFTTGSEFYTDRGNLMWTMMADTCPTAAHYSGGGFCSNAMNDAVGSDIHGVTGSPGRRGCRETIELGLEANGISPRALDSLSCFNFFMTIGNDPDGIYEIRVGKSKPGDYVDLRAEMDILWVCSCCQFLGPVNGTAPSPLKFETYDVT
ncbi:MAG: urea carboxylase-associated family protein [Alphaproteobacteria bacterium]